MSYIEKKYKSEIFNIFAELHDAETNIENKLKLKSLNEADSIAKLCATVNKKINVVLKKFYPEINNLEDKLEIKSHLKFYYDLLDKLTDFIRNVENFNKLDDSYYDLLIEFIRDKNKLIKGKYEKICRNELTAFYDQTSRNELEKIVSQKFEMRSKEFFTLGPLETEIKKIAQIAGASSVSIFLPEKEENKKFRHAKSVIHFTTQSNLKSELENVSAELINFLESKKYQTFTLPQKILTDAELLPDK